MLGALRHRGPESEGAFVAEGMAIGQTRLRIIDLVLGDPPLTNEDGTIGAVLNGEIYNYPALQAELLATGHRLHSGCDTEPLAHLAESLEPIDLCRRLDGMFAFAIADTRRGRLILGRDRLGKKPLYYWQGPSGAFAFASEIKALLADPRIPRALNADVLPSYLTFGYAPTPETFYAGIRSLPPGHVLTLDGAGQLDIAAYWEPPGLDAALPGPAPSFDEAAAEVRDLLLAAVERRLLSDVPLGAFLSGGVDSASIVAMMTQLIPGQVRTFTMGFDDTAGFDERPLARETARFLGTDHTEFQVEADRTELIERLVWHHDQPFGDSSALPTYLLAEKTKEHVTVALSGDGGDELFAGYERFGAALLADRLKWVPTAITHSVLSGAGRVAALVGRPVGERAERFTNAFDEALPWPYLEWISMVPSAWRRRLLPRAVDFGELGYAEEWRATGDCSTLGRLQTVNLRTYLLDDLLPKMDRMSMAHALEVRSPFLDTRLLEYALSLPPEYRLRGLSLKRVLKRAVAGMLPPAVLRRRKHGFGLPLDRWFRTDLEAFVDGTLCAPSARISSHLDHQSVIDLVQAQRGGCPNLANAIWSLLTLEVFLRQQGW